MRAAIAVFLAVLALWRAGVDWQGTIGQGYAYRFGTLGSLLAGHWPGGHRRLVEALRDGGPAWLWDPVGALVLSLPVALVLAALAAGTWITREHGRSRR